MAADPNLPPEEPKPPRDIVLFLNEGRLVADLATLVRPVVEPTFRLSAVRKALGFFDDLYSGCDIMELRPPSIDPII